MNLFDTSVNRESTLKIDSKNSKSDTGDENLYGVTEFQDCLYNGNKEIHSVFIPDTVKKIGSRAFADREVTVHFCGGWGVGTASLIAAILGQDNIPSTFPYYNNLGTTIQYRYGEVPKVYINKNGTIEEADVNHLQQIKDSENVKMIYAELPSRFLKKGIRLVRWMGQDPDRVAQADCIVLCVDAARFSLRTFTEDVLILNDRRNCKIAVNRLYYLDKEERLNIKVLIQNELKKAGISDQNVYYPMITKDRQDLDGLDQELLLLLSEQKK